MKVTLSSKATMFDQDSEEDATIALRSSEQTFASTRPLPRSPSNQPTDPPLPHPTATLPRDSLLWNAAHGEESRRRRSVCHTCLKEREREGESVTGEVSRPSKTITGRRFRERWGVSDRFPDYRFKLIRLTGSGPGGA